MCIARSEKGGFAYLPDIANITLTPTPTPTPNLSDTAKKTRVLIAVSRLGHCLFDLLHRWRSGVLPGEIVGVVSNHDDMRSFVDDAILS